MSKNLSILGRLVVLACFLITIFPCICFSKDVSANSLEMHIHYFVNECYQTKDDAEKYGSELKDRITKAVKDKPYSSNIIFIPHIVQNKSADIRKSASALVDKYDQLIKGQDVANRETKQRLINRLLAEENISEGSLLMAYYYIKYGEYPAIDNLNINPSFYNNIMILVGTSGRDALRMINAIGIPHMAIFLHSVPIAYSEFSSLLNVNHIKVLNFYCDEKAPFLGYDATSASKLSDAYQRYNLFLEKTDDIYRIREKNSKAIKFMIEAEATAISDTLDMAYKIQQKEQQNLPVQHQ